VTFASFTLLLAVGICIWHLPTVNNVVLQGNGPPAVQQWFENFDHMLNRQSKVSKVMKLMKPTNWLNYPTGQSIFFTKPRAV
jgi:hypothetical protein